MGIHKLIERIRILRWLIPLAAAALVLLYEVGPARWLHDHVSMDLYFLGEIILYGTLGPVMVFLLLNFMERWLEERETSELQAKVLERAQEQIRISRGLSDDALQTLFAASVLLSSLKKGLPEITPNTTDVLQETENALDRSIQELRCHLQSHPIKV